MSRRSELQTDARRGPGDRPHYGRARSRVVTIAVALLPLLLVVACSSQGDAGLGPDEGTGHPMVGTVAPQFAAQDPSGSWLPLANLKAKPVALLFIRPGAPLATDLAREMSRMRDDPRFRGIVFLGIARTSLEGARTFREGNGFSLAILRDPGSIASSYEAGNLPTVVLMDPDHIVRFRLDGFTARKYRPGLEAMVEALTALPGQSWEIGRPLELTYTEHPRAPMFEARDLDGERIDLRALRGQVIVLNFFDQECPHCLDDLPDLVTVLREFRARGVTAIGVTSRDVDGRLREFARDHGIDYPIIVDPRREIFSKFESSRTPDIHIIDRDGFIRFREQGDRPDRAGLTRLQLELALGERPPAELAAALPGERFTGDGFCRSCHAHEFGDWLLTPHSIAWESLQQEDKWRDPDCVPCHVTGPGQAGGFENPDTTPQMVNVQCEVCHGPGGGHSTGASIDPEAMSRICSNCHSGEFVLNFDLDEAMALVSHREHPDLDRLFRYSDAQKRRLEQLNRHRLEKFRSGVAHVGVEACRDCHQSQYDQWVRTPHAGAFALVLTANRSADPKCVKCHVTAAGRPGGFGDKDAPGPMTNVQCEVCHGPGSDHVEGPADLKSTTIYGITNQCSFCIIQGVCTTCHDQENDPDFDIEAALPLVSH